MEVLQRLRPVARTRRRRSDAAAGRATARRRRPDEDGRRDRATTLRIGRATRAAQHERPELRSKQCRGSKRRDKNEFHGYFHRIASGEPLLKCGVARAYPRVVGIATPAPEGFRCCWNPRAQTAKADTARARPRARHQEQSSALSEVRLQLASLERERMPWRQAGLQGQRRPLDRFARSHRVVLSFAGVGQQ